MFIGHFAVGFAAKEFAPRSSLATLLSAALLPDLLWPIFLLLGWEQVRIGAKTDPWPPLDFTYPWSHSLLMTLVWATLFAITYQILARYWPGTLAVWLGVLSHWILDWISHRPDVPLYPGGPRYGLGLWNSIPATIVVEGLMFAIGTGLYARATRATDRIGKYGFLGYVALLLLLYAANFLSGPPPSTAAIAWSGILLAVVFLPWAWWFDRHRVVVPTRPSQ